MHPHIIPIAIIWCLRRGKTAMKDTYSRDHVQWKDREIRDLLESIQAKLEEPTNTV